MVLGNLHVIVSGVVASFFAKKGDRAARMNLCRRKDAFELVNEMSDVVGCSLERSDVMCAARG